MKRRLTVPVATASAILMMTAPAWADTCNGYRECNPTMHVRVTSNTTMVGSSMVVSHSLGSLSYSWTTPGTHAYTFGASGGSWLVATTAYDIINSAGASCVA